MGFKTWIIRIHFVKKNFMRKVWVVDKLDYLGSFFQFLFYGHSLGLSEVNIDQLLLR